MDIIASHWRKVVLVIAGWTLFAFVCATQAYLNSVNAGRPLPYSRVISVWLVCGYLWAVLTPFVFLFAKRFPIANERAARSVVMHVLFGLFVAALGCGDQRQCRRCQQTDIAIDVSLTSSPPPAPANTGGRAAVAFSSTRACYLN